MRWKIMHGPIPINSAVTRNRRGRLSASRVSILTRAECAVDEWFMMDTEAFREFKAGADAAARQLRDKSVADMKRAAGWKRTILLHVVFAWCWRVRTQVGERKAL